MDTLQATAPQRDAPRGGAFDVHGLLRPSAFPHRVDTISLRETHLSWLVLTGPYAYKIKKPVRFDFIDTSTLERRRELCLEELRLNRRLAAELYLDVVPITWDGGAVRIGGPGTPLEYAVRMRQFDDAEELQPLLASDQVSIPEIHQLAADIASFHARAATTQGTGRMHHGRHWIDTVSANAVSLREHLAGCAPDIDLDDLIAWLGAVVRYNGSVFDERERWGYVREGHGDLHLGNIVRYHGRLIPFDCLEFDPALRWIDVIDDFSFLVMDLVSHNRDDVAFELLSRYLEINGDYYGLRLVPFYSVHRALVRAKVDALSMQAVPARASEFRDRLVRRMRTAHGWTQRPKPTLILMHGPSGSGKSWLSEQLVGRLRAIRVRSDVERKRLAGVSTEERTDSSTSDLYSATMSHRTYAHLCECAEHGLQAGFNMIVDATCLDRSDRELLHNLARRMRAGFVIVACTGARERLSQRIQERAAHGDRTSDADLAVLDAQLQSLEPFGQAERGHVISVDTSETNCVARVANAIEGHRSDLVS